MKKKDAFPTGTHFSLVSDNISEHDFNIMCCFAKMKKGMTKTEALAFYGLSEEDYDANVSKVLATGF